MHLFISHSAETEDAKLVLKTVLTHLIAAGHTVFVDAVIKPGTAWRSVLYHEIAVCDAAVVLFDQTSLTKRWVQREVDLLLWRHAFNPGVAIVPILLDATDVKALGRAGFREFAEKQFLLAGHRGLSPTEVATEVADRFAAAPAATTQTPMDRWFKDIELVLSRVGHPERLRDAALALGVSETDVDEVLLPGGCRFLAHQFLGSPSDTAVVDAVDRILHCTDAGTISTLVTLIAPTWVDESAALPLVLHSALSRFVAVLNARHSQTAIEYVRRATCMDARVQTEVVPAVTGEASADELLAQCERAVLRLLGADPTLGDSFDDIRQEDVHDGPPHPGFLVIDVTTLHKKVAADVVAQIRDRFRWLVVILLVGKVTPSPAIMADWRLTETKILEPPLGEYDEMDARRTARRLHNMIDLVSGGHRRDR